MFKGRLALVLCNSLDSLGRRSSYYASLTLTVSRVDEFIQQAGVFVVEGGVRKQGQHGAQRRSTERRQRPFPDAGHGLGDRAVDEPFPIKCGQWRRFLVEL